jgi:hypothetical protein
MRVSVALPSPTKAIQLFTEEKPNPTTFFRQKTNDNNQYVRWMGNGKPGRCLMKVQ